MGKSNTSIRFVIILPKAGSAQTVYKQRQEADLVVIAGDRFYINIENNGSNDVDQLKAIAKDMVSKLSDKF